MAEFVTVQVDAGVATIRVDRPKMNALSRQVQEELREAAQQVTLDREVAAVVLWGGERLFAAGADVKEMADMSHRDMVEQAPYLQTAFAAVAAIPKPVVAAVTGYALGGGLELALCADIRILGERAKVGQPETQLGIIPGLGGTQRLPRLVGPSRAKDLIFTGRHVTAEEALRIGLADQVVPDAEVLPAALAWARQFVGGAGLALAAAKHAVDAGLDGALETGLRLEATLFAGLFATADRSAGMDSFVANGPGKATFTGS